MTRILAAGVVLLAALHLAVYPAGVAAQGAPPPEPTLNVGDPAPPITIETWVKGTPVPELKKGQTYIVEFWATWCGPCKQSIPHLTELQAKLKDKNVTIIGISSSERKGLEDVTPFVEKMGDQMAYTVAWDKAGTTNAAWMAAAGQNGIPTAFVVNAKGEVAWIGHPVYPLGELDRVVEEVAANRYDVKAAAERSKQIREAQKMFQMAATSNPPDTAGVLAGLDRLMEVDTAKYGEYAVKKFEILVFILKDYDAGYALGQKLVDDTFKDNPQTLNGIAWAIVDAPGVERRDLVLALRSATKAAELTAQADPSVLNTLARIHFEQGSVDKAVEVQTKAVALALDPKMKQDFQTTLDKYTAASGG